MLFYSFIYLPCVVVPLWSLLTVNAFPYNLLSVTKKLIFKKLFQTNPLSQKLTVKFILTLFCSVFRQYFAVKQGKCSTTVTPFCSNYQNNSTSSPGFLGHWFNNLQPGCTFDIILMSSFHYDKILSKFGQ